MKALFLFSMLILSSFGQAEDFGKEIEIKKKPSGDLSFGEVFTLGASDPDGNYLLITFTKYGPFSAGTTWNLYDKESEKNLLTEWRPAFQGEGFQTKLLDPDAKKVLPKLGKIILVFRLPSGEKLHLRLGDMCRDEALKGYFKNLTNNKRCYEVIESDVKNAGAVPHDTALRRGSHGSSHQ